MRANITRILISADFCEQARDPEECRAGTILSFIRSPASCHTHAIHTLGMLRSLLARLQPLASLQRSMRSRGLHNISNEHNGLVVCSLNHAPGNTLDISSLRLLDKALTTAAHSPSARLMVLVRVDGPTCHRAQVLTRACGGLVGVAARWRVLARSRRASPAVAAYHRSARGAVRCLAVAVPHHGGAPDSNHRQHQRMLQAINRASRSSNWLIMRWLSCAYLVHREWRSQAVRCWHSRAISGCSRARPRSRSPRSRSVCRSQLASLYVRSNQ